MTSVRTTTTPGTSATGRPRAGFGDDLAAALLGTWVVGGLFLDGWAHVNQPGLETFFSPWHGVFYTGFIVSTVVLARLRREHGAYTVSYSNAGHPPPLLLLPDGTVEVWWTTPEPLLGLLARNERATHRRTVPVGATLVLYTDGLVETPGRMLDDGIALVEAALRDNAGLPGDELCARLIETASRRADDIALLLIRVL